MTREIVLPDQTSVSEASSAAGEALVDTAAGLAAGSGLAAGLAAGAGGGDPAGGEVGFGGAAVGDAGLTELQAAMSPLTAPVITRPRNFRRDATSRICCPPRFRRYRTVPRES